MSNLPKVIVVTNYTCHHCGHSWVHPRFGMATVKGCIHPVSIFHDLTPRDFPLINPLTHYVEEQRSTPRCHQCIDLTTMTEGYPPQFSRHPSHDEPRKTSTPSLRQPKPPTVDARKFLLDD